MSMFALANEETISLNGQVSERKVLADGVVTSDVEQFSSIFDMRLFSKGIFEVINTGLVNAAKYTIYGAIDPNVKWEPLPNAVNKVLAANTSAAQTLRDAYGFVKVGFTSNVAGNTTTIKVLAEGKNQ